MEFIDNHPVVDHRVRFTDRVGITEHDAELVKDGQVVVWIVQSICLPPSYHPFARDSEDRYRFNIQRVERAAALSGPLRESALAYLDDPDQRQGYLAFEAPRHAAEELRPPEDWLPSSDEPEPYRAEPLFAHEESVPVDIDGDVIRHPLYTGPESETHRLLREWGNP